MSLPTVVSPAEWQVAHEALLDEEKAATRALDALAAVRRRQPMVAIDPGYVFDGPDGPATLLDVFAGRRQLVAYHPGTEDVCPGCSSFTDNIGQLAHLNARDTTFALLSRAPRDELEAYRRRMGWTVPWYSTFGSDFNRDLGLTSADGGETFGLSVFLRDDRDVYRTYFTDRRGVDRLRLDFNLLDLTPFGRQESWEDTPEGRPQGPAYTWWRRHDEYDDTSGS